MRTYKGLVNGTTIKLEEDPGLPRNSEALVLLRPVTKGTQNEISERESPLDPSARSIWEELAEIAQSIPREEWNKLPSDLTDNLDHYIYGTPKQ